MRSLPVARSQMRTNLVSLSPGSPKRAPKKTTPSETSVLLSGVKAIEAFGSTGDGSRGCLLPADYLRSVGFKTVRPHPIYPRLRMELKSTVSWRYDVEYALEKIFGTGPARSLTPVS